jgi:hypothetical protein
MAILLGFYAAASWWRAAWVAYAGLGALLVLSVTDHLLELRRWRR